LDPNGIGIEPFGFRDGISQPGIRGFTEAEVNGKRKRLDVSKQFGSPIIATGEFVLGYAGEGGSYPDVRRSKIPDWMHDGSFQVFLRLRQDVDGWTKMLGKIADEFDLPDAAAMAIGREPGGRALAAQDKDVDYNDFTFEKDLRGEQTPRFAHIRKMNPRNGTFDDRTHRLLRRGIPFTTVLNVEPPLPNEGELAAEDIEHGLAFNAFMASIENQFEFLQLTWASSPKSLPPIADDGPDPLVGTSDEPGVLNRDGRTQRIPFGRFVSTSGAVYGFAPSRRTLRQLSAETDA
jgi:Dyp-type peroxidase family